MILADIPPPALSCPQQVPSRQIMIWGDDAAMDLLRSRSESMGWRWATMLLGEQTKSLLLVPPENLADAEICQFIDLINKGKFGKLNAGYALMGDPRGGR